MEQKCSPKTTDELNTKKIISFKSARLQQVQQKKDISKQDIIRENTELFTNDMVFNKGSARLDYINSLVRITEAAVETGKSIKFIGVDTKDYLKKESTERDDAMLNAIIKVEADYVIYPVGSAHIHLAPLEGEEPEQHGSRLGSLLLQNDKVILKVGNFYNKETDAYKSVQRDIDGFKEHHNLGIGIEIPIPDINEENSEKVHIQIRDSKKELLKKRNRVASQEVNNNLGEVYKTTKRVKKGTEEELKYSNESMTKQSQQIVNSSDGKVPILGINQQQSGVSTEQLIPSKMLQYIEKDSLPLQVEVNSKQPNISDVAKKSVQGIVSSLTQQITLTPDQPDNLNTKITPTSTPFGKSKGNPGQGK